MVAKFYKKVHFFQYCADLNTKPKSIKIIHMYAFERSCWALWENGIVYYAKTYCFEDTRVWSRRTLLNFCWVSNFFYILIVKISWTVVQTPLNHIIFSKSVIRTFSCIYVSCFNKLRFHAEVSIKLQKMHFFGQFKDHNSGRKHVNEITDPIFSSTFSALTVCKIHFCIWK